MAIYLEEQYQSALEEEKGEYLRNMSRGKMKPYKSRRHGKICMNLSGSSHLLNPRYVF